MRRRRQSARVTGAAPNTRWVDDCVVCDAHGFIKTGADLSQDELAAAHWPLPRAPHLLETSLPGVFAVDDSLSLAVGMPLVLPPVLYPLAILLCSTFK
jgi:hypothetical protein